MYEFHYEYGKLREKRDELKDEMLENMKAIKLYNWDKFFDDEIYKFDVRIDDIGSIITKNYRYLDFMWNFIPSLVSPVTFLIFMSLGNTVKYSEMM